MDGISALPLGELSKFGVPAVNHVPEILAEQVSQKYPEWDASDFRLFYCRATHRNGMRAESLNVCLYR